MFFWRRKRRGRERWIRADYQRLPPDEWSEDEHRHWFTNLPEEQAWAQWDRWSRDTVEHPRVKKILRTCLEMACECGKESHPLEFACMLRVDGDTVTELVLLPGTVQGDEHAILNLWMQPVDSTVRGSLHTHPSPHPYPSDADFELFEKHGEIHIIIGQPYRLKDFRAYDHRGVPIRLEVVEEGTEDGGPDA